MNVTEPISIHAKMRPNDLALLTLNERLDWLSFNAKVNAAMNILTGSGVLAGARVAISVSDQVLHLFFSLGLARLGAAQVALPPVEPKSVRQSLVSRLNISSVIVDSLQDELDSLQTIEVSEKLLNSSSSQLDTVHSNAGDEAFLILQSSGTTGNPKFSELTHKMALARFERYKTYFKTAESDIFWPASRLDFVVAKQRVFHSLQAGAAICLVSGTTINEELLQFLDKSGVTLACGTPSHLMQILTSSNGSISLPTLRAFEVRSATVSESLRKAFKKAITPGLVVTYATNEVEVACLASPEIQSNVPDTVGYPVIGMSVEVVDDNGEKLGDGEPGNIRISGEGVITQYLDDPKATAKSFKNGWFYPGDIGRFEAGSLVFLGRADDMMIFDGMNIYPIEIENALMLHPAVKEVAAFPLKHERFQDVPAAAVILNSTTSKEDLLAHCNQVLGLKSPKVIGILDKFPTNSMGKILKREIRKVFQKELDHVDKTPRPKKHQKPPNLLKLRFKIPPNGNGLMLSEWLVLLDDQLQISLPKQNPNEGNAGNLWLNSVLVIATGLLQTLRFPIFETAKIQFCLPDKNEAELWKAECERPSSGLVQPRVFDAVVKVAFNLTAWASTADPHSSDDRDRFFDIIEKDLRRAFSKFSPKGKSTFEIMRVANQLGIPYFPLPGGAFQLGVGSAGRRVDRSTTDHDSVLGMRWSQNKLMTAQLLTQVGLPAPRHLAAQSLEQAKKASQQIGFPLVIKPADLERGEGVYVDVNADNLERAFNAALKRSPSKTVLVEKQVAGVCHRFFIVNGDLLYAVKRLPIGVYANGQSSIKELVEAECDQQNQLPPWRRSGILPLDELATQMLRRQGWTSDSIPKKGNFVALRRIETTALGGVDEDVTTSVHPDNVRAAVDASKLFGLEVAGVDIISSDISQPWHSNGAIINEVNFAPLLGGGEISRSKIPRFLETLIKDEGRIPVHVYIGDLEAIALAQSKWRQAVETGMRAVFVSPEQTLMNDGKQHIMPLGGLRERFRALIMMPTVDALFLVAEDKEFFQSNLPLNLINSISDPQNRLKSFFEKHPQEAKKAKTLLKFLNS